jgi:hypothetical protein
MPDEMAKTCPWAKPVTGQPGKVAATDVKPAAAIPVAGVHAAPTQAAASSYKGPYGKTYPGEFEEK